MSLEDGRCLATQPHQGWEREPKIINWKARMLTSFESSWKANNAFSHQNTQFNFNAVQKRTSYNNSKERIHLPYTRNTVSRGCSKPLFLEEEKNQLPRMLKGNKKVRLGQIASPDVYSEAEKPQLAKLELLSNCPTVTWILCFNNLFIPHKEEKRHQLCSLSTNTLALGEIKTRSSSLKSMGDLLWMPDGQASGWMDG